jgi:hypothetical protein
MIYTDLFYIYVSFVIICPFISSTSNLNFVQKITTLMYKYFMFLKTYQIMQRL